MRIPFLFALTFAFASGLLAQDKDKPAAAKVDFAKEILPIFEKRCVECHSPAAPGPDGKMKKPKGSVVLTSKETILSGKKGKLIVAKKPGDSLVYQSITLAADHEDRMPPAKAKNGEPLSKEQTDLIKKWIEEGADFGTWTGKKDGEAGKETDKPKTDKPANEGGDKKKG